MSKLVKKKIEYLGIDQPLTMEEVDVEICGLKHAIKMAEELIARLEQSVALYSLEKTKHDTSQEKSVEAPEEGE